MNLRELLTSRRRAIVDRWVEAVLESYPDESAGFFKRQKNRFLNPVGNRVAAGLEAVYDGLIGLEGALEPVAALDDVVRIRAVQEFSPAQAVEFPFLLKRVVRDELAHQREVEVDPEELREFELQIDRLAQDAFDCYVGCREQVFRIRANELRMRTEKLLARTGLFVEFNSLESSAEVGDDNA